MQFRYLQALSGPLRSFDIPSCSCGIRNTYKFEIDPYRKHVLLEGLDDIGLTLKYEARITAYEQAGGKPFRAFSVDDSSRLDDITPICHR
jgi:hypothetical protein